jgi:hypothetical protein
MIVVAVSMVKNEADIIGPIVAHMLTQVDHVIVADNGSTDGTRGILDGLPITVLDDPEPAYYQDRKMTRLAQLARTRFGADWVIPFDADEWWTARSGTIKDQCEASDGVQMLTAVTFDHVATGDDDPSESDPTRRLGWRRRRPGPVQGPKHKVAVTVTENLRIHMGNHGADFGFKPRALTGRLMIRHFPYRSVEQFIAKARQGSAALAATDLPEYIGQHWRDYGRLSDAQLAAVFAEHFHADDPWTRSDLIFDPVGQDEREWRAEA